MPRPVNAEEAEVEQFYEDLLETTHKRCPFHYRNLKVGSQEIPTVRVNLAFEYKMKQVKGSQSFSNRKHWS